MRTWIAHLATVVAALATAHALSAVPQPAPPVPSIPAPRDRPYPGTITLAVDASDTGRSIIRVQEIVPVSGTRDLILLFPEWVPGHHSPTGRERLDRLAGLTVSAGDSRLSWSRDPVNVFAYHVAVPAGVAAVTVEYQYLAPPSGDYGTPQMTTELLTLDWDAIVLYPAGYFARQITFQPRITLPAGWQMASALTRRPGGRSGEVDFAAVALDTLIDSPLYAGRYAATLDLAPGEQAAVRLNLFADRPEQLEVAAAELSAHRAVVQQAYRLFGSRHYDHYDFLVTLSAALPVNGTEHHRSSFDGVYANFFSEWDKGIGVRNVLPHEYVHSWNGKFRRPADLWTPNYNVPMGDSLLWVYEGMTQYWGDVLTARAGLWSRDQALDVLALLIARYQYEPGRDWRSLQDTTNEPIISYRGSQPWATWQRAADYYRVGQLIWLDADTLIRERSGGRKSLDDFARQFFGIDDGSFGEVTYTFEGLVAALARVLPYDWAGFLRARLDAIGGDLPLDGITRGGYRLVFTDTPSEVYRLTDEHAKVTSLTYSIGVSVDKDGKLQSVLWNGPAWRSGLAPGTQVLAVDGFAFDADTLKSAIRAGIHSSEPLELIVREGARFRTVRIDYHDGLRYPHLVRDAARAAVLDQILAPRS
jgi:predicted metalloprotease with PDZ domain